MVTADGRQVIASETSHPDLFWAVRGGGGNFGVVTRFQYKLYPVGEILGGALFMPATREVLRALVPVASSAPDELTTISFLMGLPPAPFIPAERVGELSLAVMFVWSGDPAEGQAAIQPFREVATPIAEVVMPMPYPGIYEFTKEAENRALAVHRSRFLDGLADDAVDAILEAAQNRTSPFTMIQLRVLGGAMSRVANRCDRVRPSRCTGHVHLDHPVRGPGLRAGPSGLDGVALRGARAARRGRLLELPRGRGPGSGPGRLSGWHLRAPGRHQAPLRPLEPVRPEPEHPAGPRHGLIRERDHADRSGVAGAAPLRRVREYRLHDP